jgi:hypothetical protein
MWDSLELMLQERLTKLGTALAVTATEAHCEEALDVTCFSAMSVLI